MKIEAHLDKLEGKCFGIAGLRYDVEYYMQGNRIERQ